MRYTRKRAILPEIERLCSIALLAYGDAAGALKAGERERFWRAFERLRTAAKELRALLSPGDEAEWLGVPESSPLRQPRQPLPASLGFMPLPECARYFDSDGLPALLAAVADLSRSVQQHTAYLRQVV